MLLSFPFPSPALPVSGSMGRLVISASQPMKRAPQRMNGEYSECACTCKSFL